jgi:transcriptional regulator with XRE-family HTH domain
MENIYPRFRLAREMLGLSQKDIEAAIGIGQGDISLLESGNKKFVWPEYLTFLSKKGIDINSIFNERFETVILARKEKNLQIDCHLCEEKDRRISDLKDHVASLRSLVDEYRFMISKFTENETSGKGN